MILEASLVRHVENSLKKVFGPACYFNKNHGDMYQSAGRPDIEGCVMGRSFCFELKSGSRFTTQQIVHLKRAHTAGALCGGLVLYGEDVYYLTVDQCDKFSTKNKSSWRHVGTVRSTLTFEFVYELNDEYISIYLGDKYVPDSR